MATTSPRATPPADAFDFDWVDGQPVARYSTDELLPCAQCGQPIQQHIDGLGTGWGHADTVDPFC